MTPTAVEEKYGVPPDRYPELAALVGETSDNLPGVPGVGPKTAAKWIGQYDGLDNVIAHVDEIKGKAGESLRAHLGDVIRNRRLNALVRDLDLTAAADDLRRHARGTARRCTPLFDSLEFRVLRDRLFETLASPRRRSTTAASTSTAPAGAGRGRAAGSTRTRPGRAGSACTCRAPGAPAPATSSRWRSRRSTAPRRGSTSTQLDPRRRRGAGRLARRRRRSQGAARREGPDAGPRAPAAGRWPASSATPRCRPTWSAPTSARTTWPT